MKHLSTKAFAKLTGVSVRTIQRRIASGKLATEKQGRGNTIPVLSTKEYAKELGVTPATVRRRIAAGKIDGFKTGGGFVIAEQDREIISSKGVNVQILAGIHHSGEFDFADLRAKGEEATLEQAISYADPIPVPYVIFRNDRGFWQVVISYP